MSHYCSRRVLTIVLTTWFVLAGLSSSQTESSLTTEDILNIWRDQQGRLDDLYIDCDFEETVKDEQGSLLSDKHENITYMAKDNLFRTRKRRFDPQIPNKVSRDWEFSADGRREYFCDTPASYGTIKNSLPEQAGIRTSWAVHYLSCVQIMPRKKGNAGYECNLIGALEEDPRIYITEESLDGRKTVVVNRPGHSKIYLDPAFNFAVLATKATGGQNTFKSKNSNFVEVAEGIWMPLQTERTFKDGSNQITRKTKVNELKVNGGYTKDDFRINFEPGIRVFDVDLDSYITPSTADLDSFYLDDLLDMAEQRDFIDVRHVNATERHSSAVDANTPSPANRSISTPAVLANSEISDKPPRTQKVVFFICLALTAGLLALLLLKWRTQKHGSQNAG